MEAVWGEVGQHPQLPAFSNLDADGKSIYWMVGVD